MPYVILHRDSRVIRRMTVDDPPPMGDDEVSVVVPDGFDIGRAPGQAWVLHKDGRTKIAATPEERRAAFTLPHHPHVKGVLDACDAVEKGKGDADAKALARALRVLFDKPPSYE